MGYLHEGHLALVRKARELADVVVASIFVNPMQFGPKEDFGRYPRDFERDRALLERERTDIIFFPDVPEMYPEGYSTYVEVEELEDHLCGLSRKGHFIGVATVVAKLFNAVKPHFAVFGQKDYQQLKVIERMVKDLNMDVEIVGLSDGEGGRRARHELQEYLPERRTSGRKRSSSMPRSKRPKSSSGTGKEKPPAGGGGPQSAGVERRHRHRVCCRMRP